MKQKRHRITVLIRVLEMRADFYKMVQYYNVLYCLLLNTTVVCVLNFL